ncbi:hypothetical protein LC612_16965 [Nostoc sp. CHAB 5834]|nr:hypothetical protein [Nostoc sp. CHAB 5834]
MTPEQLYSPITLQPQPGTTDENVLFCRVWVESELVMASYSEETNWREVSKQAIIASVQEWMSADTGDWVCPIDLAPLVWNQLINIRDNLAPALRNQLKVDYETGLEDYQERIDQFLSLHTWELSQDKQESVKANLLRAFPTLTDLEDYLQVVIGRPVIIPALSEQLNQQQAECLNQITKFIQQYDQNLEQRLRESAIAGGEQLAAQLLEELSDWEPGRKPVQFKKKMEKHKGESAGVTGKFY